MSDAQRLHAGDHYSFERVLEEQDVEAFAALTGDRNPLHVDAEYSRRTSAQRRVVHGMLLAGIASRLVGMHLPGPGALWADQRLHFQAPVFIGERLLFEIAVLQYSESTRAARIQITVSKPRGVVALQGEGLVTLMTETKDSPERRDCRIAFVAGGSRGIGRAIALRLASAKLSVGIGHFSARDSAQQAANEITAGGGGALALQCDVRDPVSVRTAVQACAGHFGGGVDLVVVSAGGEIVPKEVATLCWQDFQSHLEVQLGGALNCVQAALPSMLQAGFGRFVLIGSSYTHGAPPPGLAPYTAAKHALVGLARSLALELGPRGVCVNVVSPGMTRTDLIASIPERLRKVAAAQVPLRRLGTPEDTAEVVTFLAGAGAGYLNGADIPVAGGAVMY